MNELDNMMDKLSEMGFNGENAVSKCTECENDAILEAAEWRLKYDAEREHRLKLEKAFDNAMALYKSEKEQRENTEYKSELYQEKILKLREKDVA